MSRKEVIASGGVRERLQKYQDELLKKKEYDKRIEVEVSKLDDSLSDVNSFESPVRTRSKDKMTRTTGLPGINKLDNNSSLVFEMESKSPMKSPMKSPPRSFSNNNNEPHNNEEREAKTELLRLLLEVGGASPEELALVLSFEEVRQRYLDAIRKLNPPNVDLPLRSQVGNDVYKTKRNQLFEEHAKNHQKYRQLVQAWDRFEKVAHDRPTPLSNNEQREIEKVQEIEDDVVDFFAIAAADIIEQADSDDDDEDDLMKWVDGANTLREGATKRREFRTIIQNEREEAAKQEEVNRLMEAQRSAKEAELANKQATRLTQMKSKNSKWLEEARRLRNEAMSKRNSLREAKGLSSQPTDEEEGAQSDEEVVEVACDLKSAYREEKQKRNVFDDSDSEDDDDEDDEERRKWLEEARCLREKAAKKVAREVEKDPTIQSKGNAAELRKRLLDEAKKLRAEALASKREHQIAQGEADKSVFEESKGEKVERKEYEKKAWLEKARMLRAQALGMRKQNGSSATGGANENHVVEEVVAVAQDLKIAYKKEISKSGVDDLSDSDDDDEWIEEGQALQEKAKIRAEKDKTVSGETQEQKRKRFLEEAKKKRATALANKRGEQILEGSTHKSVFAKEDEATKKEKWREQARQKRKEAWDRLRKKGVDEAVGMTSETTHEQPENAKEDDEVAKVAQHLKEAYKKAKGKKDYLADCDSDEDDDDDNVDVRAKWIEEGRHLNAKALRKAQKDRNIPEHRREEAKKKHLDEAKNKRAEALAAKREKQLKRGTAHKSVLDDDEDDYDEEEKAAWLAEARRLKAAHGGKKTNESDLSDQEVVQEAMKHYKKDCAEKGIDSDSDVDDKDLKSPSEYIEEARRLKAETAAKNHRAGSMSKVVSWKKVDNLDKETPGEKVSSADNMALDKVKEQPVISASRRATLHVVKTETKVQPRRATYVDTMTARGDKQGLITTKSDQNGKQTRNVRASPRTNNARKKRYDDSSDDDDGTSDDTDTSDDLDTSDDNDSSSSDSDDSSESSESEDDRRRRSGKGKKIENKDKSKKKKPVRRGGKKPAYTDSDESSSEEENKASSKKRSNRASTPVTKPVSVIQPRQAPRQATDTVKTLACNSDGSPWTYPLKVWLNEPSTAATITGTRLEMPVPEQTDLWRLTSQNVISHTAPFLFQSIDGDFEASCRLVVLSFTSTYDRAGIMLRLDEKNWVMAGLELFNNHLYLSTCLTIDHSDWSLLRLPMGSEKTGVWISLKRVRDTYEVHYSFNAKSWIEVRKGVFSSQMIIQVGICGASPCGSGFKAMFDNFRLQSL